jgi:uncharacterized membrane protein
MAIVIEPIQAAGPTPDQQFYRFHLPHLHLGSVFGDDWFALKAEAFARFFGTPVFLIGQTAVVGAWIIVNILGLTTFDIYPFILLNLAFSLQAAYAAPLILLAQTRQADRDKAQEVASAAHRDELSTNQIELLRQNTELTQQVAQLSREIDDLTRKIHQRVEASRTSQ